LPNDDGSGEPRLENEHVTSSNYQGGKGESRKIKRGNKKKKKINEDEVLAADLDMAQYRIESTSVKQKKRGTRVLECSS
jgi:hypothetical protein